MVTAGLQPEKVFEYFEKICSVPHGSGNTKQVSDLIAGFARDMGLKYRQDELNNIIIFKDASPDKAGSEPVILQGHMDMVCAKYPKVTKDMAVEGLDLVVDGDWLKAEGTSLGGDDGVAVAMALAVLADDSLSHPPLEVIFTVDEEVGMDGASGIDLSDIRGRRMINIDSEEEGVITVSCAGGVRADSFIPAKAQPVGDDYRFFDISVGGLLGGHSGCDIHKGRGNAIKILATVLFGASEKFQTLRIAGIEGGKFDNVICPEAKARVAVDTSDTQKFLAFCDYINSRTKPEYNTTDPNVFIFCESTKCNPGETAYTHEDTVRIIRAMFSYPQGVIEMSRDFKDVTQTSLNLGVIRADAEGVRISHSIRSSLSSQKEYLLNRVRVVTETAGGSVSTRGEYPGWAYRQESAFRDTFVDVYKRKTGKEPVITATHGGLECGMFIDKLPGLDCISIGPDLRDIHSPAERLNIPSVGRLYDVLTQFLAEL